MSEQTNVASCKPRKWWRRGLWSQDAHVRAAVMWRLHRYDAHLYTLIILIGVPVMGAFVHDFTTKVAIATVWFAVGPLTFWGLEGSEITAQIRRNRGLLDQEESDYQRLTMLYPLIGAVGAAVVWGLAFAIYFGGHSDELKSGSGLLDFLWRIPARTSVRFGWIEWSIVFHTVAVTITTKRVLWPLMTAFLQATAGQKRIEDETVTVRGRG